MIDWLKNTNNNNGIFIQFKFNNTVYQLHLIVMKDRNLLQQLLSDLNMFNIIL